MDGCEVKDQEQSQGMVRGFSNSACSQCIKAVRSLRGGSISLRFGLRSYSRRRARTAAHCDYELLRRVHGRCLVHLRGIHTLYMDGCKKATVTASEHLPGIQTLDMGSYNQVTISSRSLCTCVGSRGSAWLNVTRRSLRMRLSCTCAESIRSALAASAR